MPDEATLDPAEDAQDTQPTEDSQQGTPSQDAEASTDSQESPPSTDWESRYKEVQGAYTQNQQLLSALQGHQGPDAQAQALEALGLQLEAEEEAQDDWIDPDERLDRIEQMLTEREQRSQAESEAQAELEWLADSLDSLEQRENTQLSEEEINLVVANAVANRLEDGQPNIEEAYKALRAAQAAYQKSYVESKKAPKVPIGTAGEEKIDLSDDQKRQEFMERIMAAEGSDS